MAIPIAKHHAPRDSSATAKSCLASVARSPTTIATIPTRMNTAQTNQTSTAYSDGVGFFDGGRNQNMIGQWSTIKITDVESGHTVINHFAFSLSDSYQNSNPRRLRSPREPRKVTRINSFE